MLDRRLTRIDHEGLQLLAAVPDRPQGTPLLCFLHGYGEAAPLEIGKAVTKFGPLSPEAPADVLAEFFVVAPQLPLAGDHWHQQAQAVQSLVLKLEAEYGIDRARRYLTGFSYGGNGVFDLALIQPGFWTALWPVDPTRCPSRTLVEPVWLSIGQLARLPRHDFVQCLQSSPPDPALFGDRIHLDQGEDHVGCAVRAYADRRIYQWLLAHPRAP